jgi:hypothetical protein
VVVVRVSSVSKKGPGGCVLSDEKKRDADQMAERERWDSLSARQGSRGCSASAYVFIDADRGYIGVCPRSAGDYSSCAPRLRISRDGMPFRPPALTPSCSCSFWAGRVIAREVKLTCVRCTALPGRWRLRSRWSPPPSVRSPSSTTWSLRRRPERGRGWQRRC